MRMMKTKLSLCLTWIVAFTFGLLHGFGFAGALSEVGLPQSSIPLALLAFNVGVEAGQLLFSGAMLAVYMLTVYTVVRRVRPPGGRATQPSPGGGATQPMSPPDWIWDVPPYAIGGIAAFWMIERVVGFW